MTEIHDAWLARQRARWLRPNAHLYVRSDAQRFTRPAAPRFLRPDWKRHVQPGFDPLFIHALLEGKANFNPDQPRVPKGNPDGGQWTDEGGGSDGNGGTEDNRDFHDEYSATRRRDRPPRRWIGDRLLDISAEDQIRLDSYESQANSAIARVREIDPNWRPRQSQYDSTVESEIQKSKDLVLEAESRLYQLGRQTPEGLLQIYRSQNNSRDLFGNETWPREKGTVGFSILDGLPHFGVSSDAPSYKASDRVAATSMRDSLVQSHPDQMQTDNVGQKPNDALFHAEATVLLRVAKANGGTLKARNLEIHTDREMCSTSCPKVLPLMGLELGNPTVTFIGPRGIKRVMRNGGWN